MNRSGPLGAARSSCSGLSCGGFAEGRDGAGADGVDGAERGFAELFGLFEDELLELGDRAGGF